MDNKAARQRFATEKKYYTMTIPSDTENPIDIRLRQLAMMPEARFDFNKEFHNKWAVVMTGHIGDMQLRKGRIKDIYPHTRDIRIQTRKGEDIIVGYGKVITISEREP